MYSVYPTYGFSGHRIDQVICPVCLENALITPTCSKSRVTAALPKFAVYVNLESI